MTSGWVAALRASSSVPSMSGMRWSTTIKAIGSACSCARAAAPLVADSTRQCSTSARPTARRLAGSSSTASTEYCSLYILSSMACKFLECNQSPIRNAERRRLQRGRSTPLPSLRSGVPLEGRPCPPIVLQLLIRHSRGKRESIYKPTASPPGCPPSGVSINEMEKQETGDRKLKTGDREPGVQGSVSNNGLFLIFCFRFPVLHSLELVGTRENRQ